SPVVAHAQEGARLSVGRIGVDGRLQGRGGLGEVSLLEFGEAEVQLESGEFWVELKGFAVSRGGGLIFLLASEIEPKAGAGSSVVWIALGDGCPDLSSLIPFLLLLESHSIGGSGGLGCRQRAAKQKSSELGNTLAHVEGILTHSRR